MLGQLKTTFGDDTLSFLPENPQYNFFSLQNGLFKRRFLQNMSTLEK